MDDGEKRGDEKERAPAGATAQEAAPATKANATFKVSVMACNICARTVERAAKKIPGVAAAKVDQPRGEADIAFDPSKISGEEIAKRLSKDSGFKTEHKK